MRRRSVIAFLFLSCLGSLSLGLPSAAGEPPAVRGPDAAAFGWEAWLDRLAEDRLDVIFLGERHDNEHHHRWQADAVAGLEKRFADVGGVAALVFEMIPQEKEPDALAARGWPEPSSSRQSMALGDAIDWAKSGWPAWELYAPIMAAAPRAYVGGAGYTRGALMRSANSADWLSKEPDAPRFGLDAALPEGQQKEREAAQMKNHCDALPPEMLPMMVDAQRARDARMAAAVLRAREEARAHGLTGPVVVIAGSGHARRDYGAPTMLARAAPELRAAALSFLEAEPEPAEVAKLAVQYDYWAATPPPDKPRDDPCAVFRKGHGAKEK